MAEWLKAHDSKSCGQKCLGGSNPLASAISVFDRNVSRQGLLIFVGTKSESSVLSAA